MEPAAENTITIMDTEGNNVATVGPPTAVTMCEHDPACAVMVLSEDDPRVIKYREDDAKWRSFAAPLVQDVDANQPDWDFVYYRATHPELDNEWGSAFHHPPSTLKDAWLKLLDHALMYIGARDYQGMRRMRVAAEKIMTVLEIDPGHHDGHCGSAKSLLEEFERWSESPEQKAEKNRLRWEADMKLELQIGAFSHYVEQCKKKGKEFDVEECGKDVAIQPLGFRGETPTLNRAWGFLLMCVYGRTDFESADHIRQVSDATRKVLESVGIPLDEMCEGRTFNDVFETYEAMIKEREKYDEMRKKENEE
jgi:hypothetical protein